MSAITSECVICLENITEQEEVEIHKSINNIQHIFHQNCIATWWQTSETCPICREPWKLRTVELQPSQEEIRNFDLIILQ